jgi:transcriptional regulator
LRGRADACIYVNDIYALAMLTPELKKGSAEFLVLSLLEHERRHGYELNKLIESRSRGVLKFHIASLYPLLYRMEDRGWITGRWVEKAGERRRRFYAVTPAGRRALEELRGSWLAFIEAVGRVAGVKHG